MWGHPSTNHKSPHGRVADKVVVLGVMLELLYYIYAGSFYRTPPFLIKKLWGVRYPLYSWPYIFHTLNPNHLFIFNEKPITG